MPVSVRVGGVWRTATSVFTRVGGTWRTASDMPVRVGGVWRTGVLAQPAFESLATITTSSANTITFSSIPSTFQHLQVRFMVNQTDLSSIRLRLNGDSSTSSYTEHLIDGNGGGSAFWSGNAAGVVSGIFVGSANSTTNMFTAGIIDIHDYKSTTRNKTIRTFAGRDRGDAGAIHFGSGLYLSTSAVSSLTIYVSGANFSAGSTFALYGIKGE